jgi:hypothetical protein
MPRAAIRSLPLVAAALLPQAVNTFATSFPLEQRFAATADQLHLAHRARPWLDAASALALGVLALGGGGRGALLSAIGGALALRAAARLLAAEPAHPAYAGPLEIHDPDAAAAFLTTATPVVGIHVNGQARCYPLAALLKPAAVPDVVGGLPVVTTFCPMSRAAIAFRDEWLGERLRLRAVGAPHNDLAFWSDAAEGVVSQLRARVETGDAAGGALETIPAVATTWGAWRALHPLTTVATWPTGLQGAYLEKLIIPAMASDATRAEPMYKTDRSDPRLAAKTPVLAARAGEHAWAVPRAALLATPVMALTLGDVPHVAIYDPERDVAACYDARLGGRQLTFEPDGPGWMRDRETGRRWDVAGRGPEGATLRPAALVVDGVWWFAWAHAHPHAAIGGATSPRAARSPGTASRP